MGKLFYPDFFNDVFGPIMQPGSSGGFAGPCRVGYVASHLVEQEVGRVTFALNPSDKERFYSLGNFMTDRGYLGGLLGFQTDDVRLFDAHRLARERKVSYEFKLGEENGVSKALRIDVESRSGEKGWLVGASVGGGMIRIYRINGFPVEWAADTYGLLVQVEKKEAIGKQKAQLERVLEDCLVETHFLQREDGKEAYFFELSVKMDRDNISELFYGQKVVLLPAVLPVVTIKDKKPQLFTTVEQWRQIAKEKGISFVQAAIEYEKASSGWSEEQIWAFFEKIASIFDEQVHALERRNYEAEDTPLLPIYGKQWKHFLDTASPISDALTRHILTHAYSVNAKLPGVLIVPGPMGTGGGYLFSALDAVREERGFSHSRMIEALAVAAALGALAYTHTNASGEVGCVGESGVCCAMASGAVAYLAGGDGIAVERAASMALQANMGLVCDPIPGGLEFPCITRTLRAAVSAPMYAEMALVGIDPLIPYHECLQAMDLHYRSVPNRLLCGGECGCNRTETAARCKAYLTNIMADYLKYEAE